MAAQIKKARGRKNCPKCDKIHGGAKKQCDRCGHHFKMKSKKKKDLNFTMYVGPTYNIGDKITDEEGTWQLTSIQNGQNNWTLIEENLPPELKKKINHMIDPAYTGWRDKLLHFIPNVLQADKFDSNTFYKPLKEFIYRHNLVDSAGILTLNPYTDDKITLRILYRLWLLYKERMRIHRIKTRHVETDHSKTLELATIMAEIHRKENERLRERLRALEEESTLTHTTPNHGSAILFDSDSD